MTPRAGNHYVDVEATEPVQEKEKKGAIQTA